MDIVPLHHMGAEIVGLDLTKEFSRETERTLYDAWLQYGILLFRNGAVTVEQHLRLSRVFGELEQHPIEKARVKGSPDLIKIPEEGIPVWVIDGKLTTGFIFWHQDTSYTPAVAKGAILRMEKPAAEGGQTAWIDTAAAYDALSDAVKDRIADMHVEMSYHFNLDQLRFGMSDMNFRRARADEAVQGAGTAVDFAPVIHPLVVVHPESGRKSLLISPANVDRIIGISPAESDALLDELVVHTTAERFMYKHEWAAGDMVLWDNRRTCHKAFGFPPGVERKAFRTTLAGSLLSGRYSDELAA